jgi:hypothetical protein
MPTVTYKHQPGIHATRGNVPLAGTSHLYTVSKVLWPDSIQNFLQDLLVGNTLHVCCGASLLGNVRIDVDIKHSPNTLCDAARLCFADNSFDTVLCDPPYNGKFQWNHDLLSELSRVASKRIIFQHWFLVCDNYGRYKKLHKFILAALYNWQPKTYFGRVNTIQVYDNAENKEV